MFTESQSRRIAQHATTALVRAFDAFPAMLADTESDQAAEIVADVLKTQLTRPQPEQPEEDPGERLAAIIRAVTINASEEPEPQDEAQSQL